MVEARAGRPPSFEREDVLEAATRIIDRDGLAACTIRAIAEEVGVSAMAVYRTIDSKEQLLSDLPDYLVRNLKLPDNDESGLAALHHISASLTELLIEHPNSIELFYRPVVGENMRRLASEVVERMNAEGVAAERASGLLRATIALVVGLGVTGGASAERTLGPVVADAIDVFLAGIAATDGLNR